MVRVEVLANSRVNTTWFATRRLDFWAFTANAVHIGCGAAEIGNNPSETRYFVAYIFYLADDRVFASALNNATFMFCNRTKRTPTKTTPHDVDTEANHFPCGNFGNAIMAAICIGIYRMWASGVGQVKYQVHFCRG